MPSPLPPPVGFKEWSLVCRALAAGRQTVILRKGGIHEGRGGFSFQHDTFYLFPTEFHAQRQRIRPDELAALDEAADPGSDRAGERDTVTITHWAEIIRKWMITDWPEAKALEPRHIWTEEIVRERFDYTGDSCLHAAEVRVHPLPQPWEFPLEKRHGGCRSWLTLPAATTG